MLSQKIANRTSFFAAWRVLFCDVFQRRGGNSMKRGERLAGRIRRDAAIRPLFEELILTQYVVAIGQQRVGDVAHHAAFWCKAVPVQHSTLEQAWR